MLYIDFGLIKIYQNFHSNNMLKDNHFTMQVVMQFFKGMNNGEIFYINTQKCIQNGRMSIVKDDWLTSGFEVTYHSFEAFCSCKVCRWNVGAVKNDWNVSSFHGLSSHVYSKFIWIIQIWSICILLCLRLNLFCMFMLK